MDTLDKNGRQPEVGDVIKVFHFRVGRKKYYMYKVVGRENGRLVAWDATELVTEHGAGHRCSLEYCGEFEIVQGYGPSPFVDFMDRPQLKNRM